MINSKFVLTLLFLFFLILIFQNDTQAQKISIQRSTLSMCGSNSQIKFRGETHILKQSIGQAGITGTISNNDKTIIQGFIQPKFFQSNIPKTKTSTVNELNVLVETIPFSDSYKIILKDGETSDLYVSIYNMIGQKIYSQKINQIDEFEINLDSHAIGCYILCVQVDEQRFTTKLLKK